LLWWIFSHLPLWTIREWQQRHGVLLLWQIWQLKMLDFYFIFAILCHP
jgi:hypothetical protein